MRFPDGVDPTRVVPELRSPRSVIPVCDAPSWVSVGPVCSLRPTATTGHHVRPSARATADRVAIARLVCNNDQAGAQSTKLARQVPNDGIGQGRRIENARQAHSDRWADPDPANMHAAHTTTSRPGLSTWIYTHGAPWAPVGPPRRRRRTVPDGAPRSYCADRDPRMDPTPFLPTRSRRPGTWHRSRRTASRDST